jgi:protein farnesyltransferase subunit beta
MPCRNAVYAFLARMRQKDGSFVMHEGGEVDIRGAYCAVAVAKLLALPLNELFAGTAEWIARYAQRRAADALSALAVDGEAA